MRLLALVLLAACATPPPPPPSAPSNRPAAEHPVAAKPADPYEAQTWIAKLGDPREVERAITELEQLGDPRAIEPLGAAWASQGKPVRILMVIISLARPLTPAEAKAQFVTQYEASGRPASWTLALKYLVAAIETVDEMNPRSVDSAQKAAEAIGDARLSGGVDALGAMAGRPSTKRLIAAQIAAIRALGKLAGEPRAVAPLVGLLASEPPTHPRMARGSAEQHLFEERDSLYLGVSGAAINALGELRAPAAAGPLVLALYRTPELFTQVRRALVAIGPVAEKEVVAALRGDNAAVTQLFKAKRLDQYCGDRGDQACLPVSAKDFYAAVVIGDFHDPATVPELLAALKRPATPAYYLDDQPSPNTQYNAIFDSLRKLGSPDAAAPIRAIWASKADVTTKVLAVGAYPFVSRDATGVRELGKIAADNRADDQLRQEAATALARLSRDEADIAILGDLAKQYHAASAAKAREAAGKQGDADAADRIYASEKQAVDKAKTDIERAAQEPSRTAAEIRAASDAIKKLEDRLRTAKAKHKDRVAPFKNLDGAAKAYLSYARMFETHIARIEIALRCKADLGCFAASLTAPPAAALGRYIPDLAAWTQDDKRDLASAAIDRALLEIGKRGPAAAQLTDTLLDAMTSEDRLVRQGILLALPKIAPLPCASCVTKLDAAIRADDGKAALGDLTLESQLVRNYFSWAGSH